MKNFNLLFQIEKLAISQAKSIDEIERLNQMLRSGIIPTSFKQQVAASKSNYYWIVF